MTDPKGWRVKLGIEGELHMHLITLQTCTRLFSMQLAT